MQVLREMESFLTIGRSRATRSAEKVSRPFGAPFLIAAKPRNRANQIPISWGEEVVAFSVAPVVRNVGQKRSRDARANSQ